MELRLQACLRPGVARVKGCVWRARWEVIAKVQSCPRMKRKIQGGDSSLGRLLIFNKQTWFLKLRLQTSVN
jgi:hypothetical protein